MRLVPFPPEKGRGPASAPGDREQPIATWTLELDDALTGRTSEPAAERWRRLRDDVRAMAPPLDPEFERALRERLAMPTDSRSRPRRRMPARPGAPLAGWRGPALATALTLLVLVPIAIVATSGGGGSTHRQAHSFGPAQSSAPATARVPSPAAATPAQPAVAEAGTTGPQTSSGHRLQQLAASIALGSPAGEVQTLADRVGALAVADGGFVASSQVQQQSAGPSEAQLTLQLPSTSLSRALGALARLAPVESQSQSLQDVTGGYEAARRRLADAQAERAALLQALARAQTEGQVQSIRARLAQARAAIARAAGEARAVERRAANAQVEVTVLGNRRPGGSGLSLSQGLHDAERVLVVSVTVLAIAGAVLVPLALVLVAVACGWRLWVRRRREGALGRA